MMENSISAAPDTGTKPLKVKKKGFAAKLAEKKRGSQVSIGNLNDVKETDTVGSQKNENVQEKLDEVQDDAEFEEGVIHVSTKERRGDKTEKNGHEKRGSQVSIGNQKDIKKSDSASSQITENAQEKLGEFQNDAEFDKEKTVNRTAKNGREKRRGSQESVGSQKDVKKSGSAGSQKKGDAQEKLVDDRPDKEVVSVSSKERQQTAKNGLEKRRGSKEYVGSQKDVKKNDSPSSQKKEDAQEKLVDDKPDKEVVHVSSKERQQTAKNGLDKRRGSQESVKKTDSSSLGKEAAQEKLDQLHVDDEPDKGAVHVSTKERRRVLTPRNKLERSPNTDETDSKLSTPKNQPISIDTLQNGVKLKYNGTKPVKLDSEKPFSLKSIQDMPFIPQPPSTPCKTPRKSDFNHSFDETVIHKRTVIGPSDNKGEDNYQNKVLHQRSDSLPEVSSEVKSHVSNQSSPPFPILSIKEARSRSLSVGKVDNVGLFMGAQELERYFPNRQLHVWMGSWNMGEVKSLSSPMTDFLLPESCKYVQNMYVVGTQENAMNRKDWEVLLQDTLGPMFVLFHSVSHGSLHLAVFIHRDLIWFCSVPEEDIVSTRAMTMVKTKGAIAISLSFFGTSMLFINCHLTSDQSKKRDRILDYEKIISGLKLPKSSRTSKDVTANFDCVYWCGDLNFRIERKKVTVEQKVTEITERSIQNYDDLIKADQLTHILTEGRIFHGFQEGRITFPPTYKYDVSSNQFDTSNKSRIPSYTDRILFRSKKRNHISCIDYNSVMSVKMSDHKPVYGIYQMALKPSKEIRPSAAGHFDKDVYLKANQKLASQQTSTGNQKHSSICSIQ